MKRFFLRIFLIGMIIFVSQGVFAQSMTIGNCDVCGYCKDDTTTPSSWVECKRCVYPEDTSTSPESNTTISGALGIPTPHPDFHYTMVGCISTKPAGFTNFIVSKVIVPVVGGIAFLYLLYGAGIVASSQTDPGRLNYGKKIIYAAIIGLVFVLLSTFMIKFIAVDILKLPDFAGGM